MTESTVTIEATDLSPITRVGEAEDAWLRQLARRAEADTLALRLSGRNAEQEPIVYFDACRGSWWTGRYIGEVAYQDGTLRILPRFGIPQLGRWLGLIWGVRILSSRGKYETSRLWLWELLAKLWEARLLAAAKHGLPARRVEETYRGATVRGRLDIRSTARELGTGRRNLVSRSRNRSVDREIASVLLCAFENLRGQLRHLGDHRTWLTPRAQSIIGGLQGQYGHRVPVSSVEIKRPIRYTPITESYRPAVDLSLAIIRQRPMSSAAAGQQDVFGALIDMAEVWEMYIYQLLNTSLIELDVCHTGRAEENEEHLLRSTSTGERLGGLKPDILIRSLGSRGILAVLDAKYKNTTRQSDRPFGVHREDLYQMIAYLSSLGQKNASINGGLVYPAGAGEPAINELQDSSPWSIRRTESAFWFLGVDCSSGSIGADGLTTGEVKFVERMRSLTESDETIRRVLVGV